MLQRSGHQADMHSSSCTVSHVMHGVAVQVGEEELADEFEVNMNESRQAVSFAGQSAVSLGSCWRAHCIVHTSLHSASTMCRHTVHPVRCAVRLTPWDCSFRSLSGPAAAGDGLLR